MNGPFYGDLTKITFDCIHQTPTKRTTCSMSTLSEALRPNSDFVPNFYPAGGQRERLATSNSWFASWRFSFSLLFSAFSLLFSVSSTTTRCSISANVSFFFSLHFLQASLFLSLFACSLGVRKSASATSESRGSSGPSLLASSCFCKHSHILTLTMRCRKKS